MPLSLDGTITDADGNPVDGAAVTAVSNAGDVFRSTTTSTGEYEIVDVPDDTYHVMARPGDGGHHQAYSNPFVTPVESIIESFEEGDLQNYEGDTSEWGVNTDYATDGSYALQSNTQNPGTLTSTHITDYDVAEKTAWRAMDTTASGWQVDDQQFYFRFNVDTNDDSYWAFYYNAGDVSIQRRESGSTTTLASESSAFDGHADEWLYWEAHYDGTDINLRVEDSGGTVLTSLSATADDLPPGKVQFRKQGASKSTTDGVYIDQLEVVE